MHDDHTPRRFPWFRLVFGGISILVLVGSFGGFMWLLRTYVDPPRMASTAPMRLAAVDPAPAADTSTGPRVIMASPALVPEPAATHSGPVPERPEPALPSSITIDRPAAPKAGPAFPSWAGSPLTGTPPAYGTAGSPSAAGSLPASTEAGTVSLDGPVPLPRPKPRMVVRVQLPAAAPLPRPRPPA